MTDQRRDPEFDAISEKEIFEEARDRLSIANDAESANRSSAKADLLFREGEQWDSQVITSASEERPELTINLTDMLCQRTENNIKQQRPRGKCHPVGDGADIDIAQILNGMGRHVETRSEASVAYDQGAKSALTAGVGYFRLIAEFVSPRSFQKDLRILPIRNIFTVYMDPASIMPSGADANWAIISVKQRLTEYRRLHPQLKPVPFNDNEDKKNRDWQDKEEIRLAEYFRIREKAEKLYLLRGQDGEFGVYESELPRTEKGELDTARITAGGRKIEGDRESTRRTVEWFVLNGLKVIQREKLPGTWIPLFRVEGNTADVDGKVIRRGMVRPMKDAQRMVNYGEVAKIRRLALTPQAQWVYAEGQLDGHPEWDDANISAYSKLPYKPVTIPSAQGEILLPPPQRQQPAQIEAGFAEFVQGMRTNLLAIAGMPNEPGADAQGQVVSGEALRRRQGLQDQSHFQYYDNLTLAISQCWRVMVEWFPYYFPEKGRIQRVIGEDSTPEMKTLNETYEESPGVQKIRNDISVGRYDVVMETGPGFETKREEGAENLLSLLQSPPIAELISKVGMDLVFRSIDHPYMQELADRISAMTPEGLDKVMEQLPERAKAIVRSMGAQLQQLKQKLQEMQLEQKYDIAGKHLAATVKAHDTEESNKTKRMDTIVRSQTARDVAEIKEGGAIIRSHVDNAHDRAQAERQLEIAEHQPVSAA